MESSADMLFFHDRRQNLQLFSMATMLKALYAKPYIAAVFSGIVGIGFGSVVLLGKECRCLPFPDINAPVSHRLVAYAFIVWGIAMAVSCIPKCCRAGAWVAGTGASMLTAVAIESIQHSTWDVRGPLYVLGVVIIALVALRWPHHGRHEHLDISERSGRGSGRDRDCGR